MSGTKMNVAVIGAGRMGRHHARTYAGLPGVNLIAVVDPSLEKAQAVTREFGGEPFTSVDELLAKSADKLAAVSIACTTSMHEAAAAPFLQRGIGCLIEKPIAADSQSGKRILATAKAGGAVLQIGHTERFNPPVRALASLGLRPRYLEVVRVSPMTFRSLDVGVVMDMMIHDLDIILSLVRSPLVDVQATGVTVIADHEDVANARLVFEDGCVANVTASRMALKTDRRLRLFAEEVFVSVDFQKRTGVAIRKTDNASALADVRARLASGQDLSAMDYAGLVKLTDLAKIPVAANDDPSILIADPLAAELTSFLGCVKKRSRPVVDGADGLAAVELAERILKSIQQHRFLGLQAPRVV